jgi:hypothetical protein
MIKTFGDIKTSVIVKLGISTTTSSYYTDTIINNWIFEGARWATSFSKWPLTEGRLSTTFVAGTEEWGFEGLKAETVRFLKIGTERFRKLNFDDYQIFREEESSSTERVFSDFGRILFINPKTDASGTLAVYGQYAPKEMDVTSGASPSEITADTVFSASEQEGNEAIVEKVLSYAMTSERKPNDAENHHLKAVRILQGLEKRFAEEHYQYQTHPSRGGMFKRINVLKGGIADDLNKRDQF